jgi:ADP-heptose:LPS heptosyltransferase
LRVGIVWSGNPAHRDDKRRSMSLAQFARIIRNDPRISFHILQAEIRDSDKETLAAYPHIHNHAPQQVDFGESAALMLQLDLVIGIDTSVMHLCGALGIPGWVLLMHVADWRWLLARDDSPWYPSLELFRQPRHGDWDAVLDNVSARLDELLA